MDKHYIVFGYIFYVQVMQINLKLLKLNLLNTFFSLQVLFLFNFFFYRRSDPRIVVSIVRLRFYVNS